MNVTGFSGFPDEIYPTTHLCSLRDDQSSTDDFVRQDFWHFQLQSFDFSGSDNNPRGFDRPTFLWGRHRDESGRVASVLNLDQFEGGFGRDAVKVDVVMKLGPVVSKDKICGKKF